jgi:hypothetical protein
MLRGGGAIGLVMLVLALGPAWPAVARAGDLESCGWEWRAHLENDTAEMVVDLAQGSDDNYTGGWQLSGEQCWIPKRMAAAHVYDALWRLTFPDAHSERRLQTSWSVGMKFYSPNRIDVETPQPDRPFAGVTSARLGATFGWDTTISSLGVAVDLGVVGSWSAAEEFQSFIHSFVSIDSKRPLGWKYQVGHGLEANLDVTWNQELWVWDAHGAGTFRTSDLVLDLDAVAGTTWDRAGVGLTWRFGKNVPAASEHGPIPQAAGLPGDRPPPGVPKPELPWSYYFTATAHGRAVLRNGYLQGSLVHWGDDSPVTREPRRLVGELGVGGSFIAFPWHITYGVFWRTREMSDVSVERTLERFAEIEVAYLVP